MSNSYVEENKNKYLKEDGLVLLSNLQDNSIHASIQDYQYREVLDKLDYGNAGKGRQATRIALPQMPTDVILKFLRDTERVLIPSGYLFLWVDKYIMGEGIHKTWFPETSKMFMVDFITWDKELIGNGYRSRRQTEFLLIYQKHPKMIKTWKDKSIGDCWREKIINPRTKGLHPHRKPVGLISRLIQSVTNEGDLVLDPCAGSFSTFDVCRETGRDFVGCDLTLEYVKSE